MLQLIITIVSFLIIDFVWIALVVNPLYKKNLPEDFMADPVRMTYAVAFYLLFSFTLWFLFIRKNPTLDTELLLEVFLFGLTAYATYSLTNMAIIEAWNIKVTIPDLIWGGVLSVLVTIVTIYVSKLLGI
jgi:uncharacterized membrane protein